MDALAERVQTLGGVALAPAHDVVEENASRVRPRAQARGGSTSAATRYMRSCCKKPARSREAAERGDDCTNDLIVSQVVRTNELQSWFVHEHLQKHDEAPRSSARCTGNPENDLALDLALASCALAT